MEVIDRISVSPTGSVGPFKSDAPLQAVVIQKVELLADAPAPAATATPPAGETAPATPPAEPAKDAGAPPPQQ
jgi:hypothetical protein